MTSVLFRVRVLASVITAAILLGGAVGCRTTGGDTRAPAGIADGEQVQVFATIVGQRRAAPASPELAAALATLPTAPPPSLDAAGRPIDLTDADGDGVPDPAPIGTVTDAPADPDAPVLDDGLSANSPSLQAARDAATADDPFAELDEAPTTYTLVVHQAYAGDVAADRLTVRAERPTPTVPLQAREAATQPETVLLVTLQRVGDQLALVYAKGPDFEKWQCHKCGRRLQAFRFVGNQYLEIRWFCPAHGYRDLTFEAFE